MLGNASHHNKAVVITPFTKYFFSVKRVIKFILVSVEKRKGIINNILVSIRFVICACFEEIAL